MLKTPDELKRLTESLRDARRQGPRTQIRVSLGTCGIAAGTLPVLAALREVLRERGLEQSVEVVKTGCMGLCHSEPAFEVVDIPTGRSVIYGPVAAEQVHVLLEGAGEPAKGLRTVPRAWYYPEDDEAAEGRPQVRIILRTCGRIDPERIEDYIAGGGYEALGKALTTLKPGEVIDLITRSGLRGRGQRGRKVSGLQCRRGRSGRVYEPRPDGGRPTPPG